MTSRAVWFLDKTSYHLDKYVFWAFGAALTLYSLVGAGWSWRLLVMPVLVFGGIWTWSFIEYSAHRWLFHGPMSNQHMLHHQYPESYVGVPNWLSIGIFILFFALLSLVIDTIFAAGLSVGIILGYLWYLKVHDRFHHSVGIFERPLVYLYGHHNRHHRSIMTNFGVSTRFWDNVFKTMG